MPIFLNEVDAREVNPPRDSVLAELWAAIQEHRAEIDRLERKYSYREQTIRQDGSVVAETWEKISAREQADRLQQKQRANAQAAVNIAAIKAQEAELERRQEEIERITGRKLF